MWFSRVNNDKAITPNMLGNEIYFGSMEANGKVLTGLEKSLAKIMLPLLQSQEVIVIIHHIFRDLHSLGTSCKK